MNLRITDKPSVGRTTCLLQQQGIQKWCNVLMLGAKLKEQVGGLGAYPCTEAPHDEAP